MRRLLTFMILFWSAFPVFAQGVGDGGMFMMVPVASVIYTLIREYTQQRLDLLQIDEDKLRPHPPKLQSHLKMKHAKMKEKRVERRTARKEKRNETK